MYQILIPLFIFSAITLLLIYGADKELKYLSQLNIKNVKLLTLKKGKIFFVYHKRKENIITKHAFVCMIMYYIINLFMVLMILFYFIYKSEVFLKISIITLFLNLLLFIVSSVKMGLNEKQKKIKLENQIKYRTQMKLVNEVKALDKENKRAYVYNAKCIKCKKTIPVYYTLPDFGDAPFIRKCKICDTLYWYTPEDEDYIQPLKKQLEG